MTVFIAALGYFVDIFDLYLFGVVRVNSLKDLGVSSENLMNVGISLLNFQMSGLIIGGLLWGVLGDKRGRASVLFGSIFLYSIANILNGFVSDIEVYKYLRFFAGLGLAGELGAAITLVSELLPRQTRGYGATIVAGVGLSGSVAAALVSEVLPWRQCYFLGGALGLLLLFLRFKVRDSNMFSELKKNKGVVRGNLLMLFSQPDLLLKYFRLIFIGMPIWFVGGLLVTFSPEFSKELGVQGTVTAGRAIYFTYIGVAIGDFASGFLSQYYLNRKKVIFVFILIEAILIGAYLYSPGVSINQFYYTCWGLGFATGYWAVLMMTTAEHFGTNLRATATTSIPNFIRGSVVIVTILFQYLKPSFGLIASATIVGGAVLVLSLIALMFSEETFNKNLDYIEH